MCAAHKRHACIELRAKTTLQCKAAPALRQVLLFQLRNLAACKRPLHAPQRLGSVARRDGHPFKRLLAHRPQDVARPLRAPHGVRAVLQMEHSLRRSAGPSKVLLPSTHLPQQQLLPSLLLLLLGVLVMRALTAQATGRGTWWEYCCGFTPCPSWAQLAGTNSEEAHTSAAPPEVLVTGYTELSSFLADVADKSSATRACAKPGLGSVAHSKRHAGRNNKHPSDADP